MGKIIWKIEIATRKKRRYIEKGGRNQLENDWGIMHIQTIYW